MKVRSRLERIVCPEKDIFMIRKNGKGATDTVIKTTDGRLRLGKEEGISSEVRGVKVHNRLSVQEA